MRGEFTAELAGTEVDLPCSDGATEGVEIGELYFVVEAGEGGARVESVTIHYHEPGSGQQYALRVPWEMVACGDDVRDDVMC
jgi:hypothetical protein